MNRTRTDGPVFPRTYTCGAAVVLVALLACTGPAFAAGGFEARARRPVFDSSALELIGAGGYRSATPSRAVRVTVCLRKRYGRRLFDVRCASASANNQAVRAQVTVPGCVSGIWRTTALGETLGPHGNWVDRATSVSRAYRC